MTTPIEVAVENGVQTIRLNRPEKKNAITSAMYAAMAEAIKAGWADDAVRATLFLGTPGLSRPATTLPISCRLR